jgi:hypothetical protein
MKKRPFRRILWVVLTCIVIWAVVGLVPSRAPWTAYVPGRKQLRLLGREASFFGDTYQCNVRAVVSKVQANERARVPVLPVATSPPDISHLLERAD